MELDPSAPSGPPSVHPSTLLWNYELRRENNALATHAMETRKAMAESETVTRTLVECLNELIIIAHSIATAIDKKVEDGHHRQGVLRRQLQHIYRPLRQFKDTLREKITILNNCIGEIERLYNLPEGSLSILSNSMTDDSKEQADQSLDPDASTASTGQLIKTEDMSDEAVAEAHLTAVMNQNGRSLDEYYDAAKDFRRQQRRLRNGNEALFIDAFIAGLEKNIYRRRIIHWLRKERWDWAWLEHIVMFIILEEEYFQKQDFALAHQFEDGSILLPDGSRQCRFVILSPITEEDLTPSEGD